MLVIYILLSSYALFGITYFIIKCWSRIDTKIELETKAQKIYKELKDKNNE